METFWRLIILGTHLQPVLTKNASITTRRCKKIRDHLVHSHYQQPQTSPLTWLHNPLVGTYSCGHCVACKFIQKDSKLIKRFDNKKEFKINTLFNCNSAGLVYLLECSCGLKYVGKTFRPFKSSIRRTCDLLRV